MADDVLKSGGGSGGGDDGNNTIQSADGTYEIAANQLFLVTKDPDNPPFGDHIITILAAGKTTSAFMDGRVDVRGSGGVRITAGPAPALPTTSPSTNGVEVAVGETQNVTIQRGLLPTDQKIEMSPGVINIDAGMGIISIKSFTSIELSVCDGLSKISLTPAGIVIQGVLVEIN